MMLLKEQTINDLMRKKKQMTEDLRGSAFSSLHPRERKNVTTQPVLSHFSTLPPLQAPVLGLKQSTRKPVFFLHLHHTK